MLILPPDKDEALKNLKLLIFWTVVMFMTFLISLIYAFDIPNYSLRISVIVSLVLALLSTYYLSFRKLKLDNEDVVINFHFPIEEQLKLKKHRQNTLILGALLGVIFFITLMFALDIEDTVVNIFVIGGWCLAFLAYLYIFLKKY